MTSSRYDEIMKTKPYLPFHMGYLTEAMVATAESELGETEEVKAKTIPELRDIVENEPKLVCPTDDAYLLQYLRARKHNVKRAFQLVQNYHNVKKNYCDMYGHYDEEKLKKVSRCGALSCFPYRDEDGCAIFHLKLANWDPDQIPIQEGVVGMTVLILFCIEDVATQICGVRLLVDVMGVTFKQLRSFSPRYMNLLSKALRNCLPCRFKAIHIYNESVVFGYIYSVFKLFLSEKIKKRVHFHGDNQKNLHKFIPKAILPSEYGGDDTQYSTSSWFESELEKFFPRYQELTTYGYRK